jgi:nitrate reductase assembly molybdenum cofactor insertion protein NarJ
MNIDQQKIVEPLIFFIASRLFSYPDSEWVDDVNEAIDDPVNRSACRVVHPESWDLIVEFITAGLNQKTRIADLGSDYIDLFDRRQNGKSLYETEYGLNKQFTKGADLADLAGFYHAFGLNFENDCNHEMMDHISVELEFYFMLMIKYVLLSSRNDREGVFVVDEACEKFLHSHLSRFIGILGELHDSIQHPFYQPLFNWGRALIDRECRSLNVEVMPEQLTIQAQPETMQCGCLSGCAR